MQTSFFLPGQDQPVQANSPTGLEMIDALQEAARQVEEALLWQQL